MSTGKNIDFNQIAKDLRKKILKMSFAAHACHLGSAMSCVEIMLAVSQMEGQVFFSKASGAATVYALQGKSAKYLKENPLCWPGGSLGHALPIAAGYALGKRDERVFCVMSDAEFQEGTTWESLMFAAHHKLGNLTVLIDRNRLQACGHTEQIVGLEPLFNKLQAFKCEVREVQGHNVNNILEILQAYCYGQRPVVIICDTIKGRGIDFMEGRYQWHYANLTKSDLENALKQL